MADNMEINRNTMKCPKCHVDKNLLSEQIISGWDGKDFDVEMEDKGTIGIHIEYGREVYDHLLQCPVCKNIEIQ